MTIFQNPMEEYCLAVASRQVCTLLEHNCKHADNHKLYEVIDFRSTKLALIFSLSKYVILII